MLTPHMEPISLVCVVEGHEENLVIDYLPHMELGFRCFLWISLLYTTSFFNCATKHIPFQVTGLFFILAVVLVSVGTVCLVASQEVRSDCSSIVPSDSV